MKIPKIKLYQKIKVDVRCFSEVEEGNAEQFWCSSSSPGRRPTYPPSHVQPAHHAAQGGLSRARHAQPQGAHRFSDMKIKGISRVFKGNFSKFKGV